jgi:two-component system sensor histidine kinase DesK
VLGWAVREGVTNVVRHGRSRTATIRVHVAEGTAAVDIENDRAADARADVPAATPPDAPGTGLAGLRERVAIVGGKVEAGPLAEGGFRLRVSVPIA